MLRTLAPGVAVRARSPRLEPYPHQLQRLTGLGRRVGVAERLGPAISRRHGIMDLAGYGQSAPLGRVLRPRGRLSAVSTRDPSGDRLALVHDEHLDVRRQRRQPTARAPRVSSSRHCASSRPSATIIALSRLVDEALVRQRPARGRRLPATRSGWHPRRHPTTFSAAMCCSRPSSTGSSASGRARVMRTSCRAPASSVTFTPSCLSARSSLTACSATTRRGVADRPSDVVIVSAPGRPFIRPTRTVSARCPAASAESSRGRPRSTAVWTASPRSMTALGWS